MSHVMHYGDLSIANEFVADFQGWKKGPEQFVPDYEKNEGGAWPSRDIPLLMLEKQYQEEDGMHQKFEIRRQIRKLERKREYLHNFMKKLVERIIHDPVQQRRIMNVHPETINDFQCHDKLLKAFHKICFNLAKVSSLEKNNLLLAHSIQ
ncbi:unnamed protein product [Anisakis simplex]|uniref:Mediator of RNA polymerase II transcription subunit 7 n=1 Tax=Anisakis simplex TaxID=6269 RepID=A0A0M3J880_ANISI|nr:unnamed protein product [Anisakis simplex]